MDFTKPPEPLRKFFAYFPLRMYPPIHSPTADTIKSSPPAICISPPRDPSSSVLSSEVECLTWQAYLALRNVPNVSARWDIAPEGGVNGRLPMLIAGGEMLGAEMIPGWVDGISGSEGVLEGYRDEAARDESRAWISLLEGNMHAALALSQPAPTLSSSLLRLSSNARPLESVLSPPPAPLSGISSLLPPHGTHILTTAVQAKYSEAIDAISERLGTDQWFLGSSAPTALDALLFAYLHCILTGRDSVRFDATRRVNLVAWERRVRTLVQTAFPAIYPQS